MNDNFGLDVHLAGRLCTDIVRDGHRQWGRVGGAGLSFVESAPLPSRCAARPSTPWFRRKDGIIRLVRIAPSAMGKNRKTSGRSSVIGAHLLDAARTQRFDHCGSRTRSKRPESPGVNSIDVAGEDVLL